MSYTYTFFDNQLIGVDELNKITSRFVTSGIAREPSTVSDLNEFIPDIATKGVVGNSSSDLKVTIENNKIKINNGVAFFDNGTVIEVTEPEFFDFTSGVKLYVYLKSDSFNNSIYPIISEAFPNDEENIVHLAEISEDGTITDKRTYARGKCAYYYSTFKTPISFEITFTQKEIESKLQKIIDIGSSDFTFMNVFGYRNGYSNYSTVNLNVYFDENGNTSRVKGIVLGDSRKDVLIDEPCWGKCTRVNLPTHYCEMDLTIDAQISDGNLILTPRDSCVLENIVAKFQIQLC